jgi:hypothetical protein
MMIADLNRPNEILGEYLVTGVGGGLAKAKFAVATGPSATSDFESDVKSVDQFFGQVQSQEVSGAIIIGYNYQKMTWLSGPAKGTVCEGTGWLTMIGASIGASGAVYNFKFLRMTTIQQRRKSLIEYHEPEVRRVSQKQF